MKLQNCFTNVVLEKICFFELLWYDISSRMSRILLNDEIFKKATGSLFLKWQRTEAPYKHNPDLHVFGLWSDPWSVSLLWCNAFRQSLGWPTLVPGYVAGIPGSSNFCQSGRHEPNRSFVSEVSLSYSLQRQMTNLALLLWVSEWLAISNDLKRGWNQWFQIQINVLLLKPQRKYGHLIMIFLKSAEPPASSQ